MNSNPIGDISERYLSALQAVATLDDRSLGAVDLALHLALVDHERALPADLVTPPVNRCDYACYERRINAAQVRIAQLELELTQVRMQRSLAELQHHDAAAVVNGHDNGDVEVLAQPVDVPLAIPTGEPELPGAPALPVSQETQPEQALDAQPELDPIEAAPAQTPAQPQARRTYAWVDLAANREAQAAVAALEKNSRWMAVQRHVRKQLIRAVIVDLVLLHGQNLTIAQFEQEKPTWMPGFQSLSHLCGRTWLQMRQEAIDAADRLTARAQAREE